MMALPTSAGPASREPEGTTLKMMRMLMEIQNELTVQRDEMAAIKTRGFIAAGDLPGAASSSQAPLPAASRGHAPLFAAQAAAAAAAAPAPAPRGGPVGQNGLAADVPAVRDVRFRGVRRRRRDRPGTVEEALAYGISARKASWRWPPFWADAACSPDSLGLQGRC